MIRQMSALILPLLPFFAHAQTCFQTTSAVPATVPSVVCLEKIVRDGKAATLTVVGTDQRMVRELTITDLAYENPFTSIFQAEANWTKDMDPACGPITVSTLKVTGLLVDGSAAANTLTITAEISASPDVCHIKRETSSVPYKMVQ